MATIEQLGIAGMSNELKQTYDRMLLNVADKDTILLKYAPIKRQIPARGGKSIEFRRFERIDVNEGSYTMAEGSLDTNLQVNATISSVAATISQYGQYAKISDVLETQSFDPIIAEYVEKFGLAAAEGLEIIARTALSSATTIQYAGDAVRVGTSGTGAVGSGDYMNAAELLEAGRTLRRAGARRVNGRWLCFVHPDNVKDLFEDPDIVDAFQHAAPREGDNPLFTGYLGDWMGFRFIETNMLRVRSSYGMSGADVYEVLICGDEAFGVTELSSQTLRTIIHDKKTEGGPLEQYSTIGWKAAMACTILNNNFMVLLNTASSRTPSA